jgi:hypothetical protein
MRSTVGQTRTSVRVVNDRIAERQNGSLITFVCECGDLSCWETVTMSAAEYAAFQAANEGAPLLAPTHAGASA